MLHDCLYIVWDIFTFVWDIITFDIKSNLISFSFEREYKILKQDFYFLYVLSILYYFYLY